jgi:hypothetical protein
MIEFSFISDFGSGMLPKVAHLCCAHLSNPLVTNIEYSLFKPPSMGDIHGIAARKLEILTEKPVTQPILRATFAQHACIPPKKAPGFGVKPGAGYAIHQVIFSGSLQGSIPPLLHNLRGIP